MSAAMHADIALNMICQGERYRPLDGGKAREIARSMQFQGLLQPIGVRPCTCDKHDVLRHFRLLFGAHRLEAADALGWEKIAATVFADDMTEEMARLAELQENSARHDLTGKQRHAYTAEVGRLLSEIARISGVPPRNDQWLQEIGKTTGVSQSTMYEWWSLFCSEAKLDRRPRDAEETHKEQFFHWLEMQQQKAEAEKQRRESEVRLRRQQEDFAEAREYLQDLIRKYGKTVVWEEVIQHIFSDTSSYRT